MAVIADSGAIYAIYDSTDAAHEPVLSVLRTERRPIIIPVAILAELDYLLLRRLGVQGELDFLEDLNDGAYLLSALTVSDQFRIRELVERYRDLKIGLADAAVIATAERLETLRILTVDLRHFRAVQTEDGRPFTLLPADAAR
jgi:uncharacterized protein